MSQRGRDYSKRDMEKLLRSKDDVLVGMTDRHKTEREALAREMERLRHEQIEARAATKN